MRNPGSRELRRRQARYENQQRSAVREQTSAPRKEDVLKRGGLLEGLSPRVVTRVALAVSVGSVVVVAAGGLGLLIEIGTIAVPAMQAVRRDRKLPARTIQGQLVGASLISPTPGLATLVVNVGRQVEQFRVRRELFDRVKVGATVVGITVTPSLSHVQTLTVIRRDRMAAMTTPPITRSMRFAVWLPLASVGGLVAGVALGGLVGALLPLGIGAMHALVTLFLVALLAGGVTLFSRWYGSRLMKQLELSQ